MLPAYVRIIALGEAVSKPWSLGALVIRTVRHGAAPQRDGMMGRWGSGMESSVEWWDNIPGPGILDWPSHSGGWLLDVDLRRRYGLLPLGTYDEHSYCMDVCR